MTAMKLRHLVNSVSHAQDEIVARFGEAALIRQSDGTYRLDGGSQSDCTDATEWISLFMHEAVFDLPLGRKEPKALRVAA